METKSKPTSTQWDECRTQRVLSFSEMIKALKDSSAVSEAQRMHVIRVHDDLDVARSIAGHLFEKPDPNVIMAVYDRLVRNAPVDAE